MPHGIMIGAGLVALVQIIVLLVKKPAPGEVSAVGGFTRSMTGMRKALGGGFLAYVLIALFLALVGGLITEMSLGKLIFWLFFAAFAAIASEMIVGISAMYSGWFPGFATALIFLIVGTLLKFPPLALALLVGYTAATGPAFSDMAYDLKSGYILRGNGEDPEFEKEGRKQQYITELISFVVSFIVVGLFAKKYFANNLFAPVSKTFVATIQAGSSPEIAKLLLIWCIPGGLIQLLGGKHQIGILFSTGLLVGSTISGLTVLVALLIRFVLVRKDKKNEQILNILGAGSLAGAAIYSFFTATLKIGKK